MMPEASTPDLYRKQLSFPPTAMQSRNQLFVVTCLFTFYLVTKVTLITNRQLYFLCLTRLQYLDVQQFRKCAGGTVLGGRLRPR